MAGNSTIVVIIATKRLLIENSYMNRDKSYKIIYSTLPKVP
jgi:hypothetical protein